MVILDEILYTDYVDNSRVLPGFHLIQTDDYEV
jgi:hypothetical protein